MPRAAKAKDAPAARSDLLVIYRDPKELAPYSRNARTHSPEQLEQIKASIAEFGFTNPVLLKDDERTIGAGHARTLAALALGLARIPTITLPGLSPAQWRAYVIADNQLALNAGWDNELLKLEFGELQSLGFDLTLTGFTLGEIAGLGQPDPGRTTGVGSLAEKFMIPPFSVLNAREGWWQDRKRAWLLIGIQSELGRGDTAVNSPHEGHGMADGLVAVRAKQKANATPGGSMMPSATLEGGKTVRGDGRARKVNVVPGGGSPRPLDRMKAARAAAPERQANGESNDLRGDALALRTTTDPYRKATPGG